MAMPRLKILVVEDDEATQLMMRIYLDKCGFACVLVSNGQEAVDELKKNAYDVVLMDLRMPVMDGFEATRIIRREISPSLPVVAVTAHAMESVKAECYAAGMNGFMTKPIIPEKLAGEILRYFNVKNT